MGEYNSNRCPCFVEHGMAYKMKIVIALTLLALFFIGGWLYDLNKMKD